MAFNDDFNRADNAALGNGWTDDFFHHSGGAIDVFQILGNQARGGSTGVTVVKGAKAPGTDFQDWDITVKMTRRGGAAGHEGGIIARGTAFNTFYILRIFPSSNLIRIAKFSPATGTNGANLDSAPADGNLGGNWALNSQHTARFKVVGTSFEGYTDNVLRISGTDNDITAAGASGLFAKADIIDFDDYSTGPAGDNFDSVIPIRLRSIVNLDSLTPLLTRATLVFDHSIIPVTWDMCKVIINCLAGEIRAGEVEVAGKMHCLLRADQLIPLLIRARVLLDSIIPITISREGLSVFDFVIAILIRRLEAVDQTIPIQWSVLDQWVKDAASQAAAWTGDPSSESDVWVKDPASEADAWIGA